MGKRKSRRVLRSKPHASYLRQSLHVGFQIEISDQAVQVFGVDSQEAGGLDVVTAGFVQGGEDQLFFRLVQRVVVARRVQSGRLFLEQCVGQVFRQNFVGQSH